MAIFGLGIAFGVLYFLDVQQRRNLLMAGPICLAVGLLGKTTGTFNRINSTYRLNFAYRTFFKNDFLVFICGLVWIPIIKTKLKKKIQQQKTQNRYGI